MAARIVEQTRLKHDLRISATQRRIGGSHELTTEIETAQGVER